MLKNYYESIILYDFLNKILMKNIFEIIKIKKITISINFINIIFEKKKIIDSLFFLQLISNQKIKINKVKKTNIFIKIKKNSIISCTINLKKQNIFIFLEKLIISLIIEKNNFTINKKNNNINFKINNISNLIEFRKESSKFQNISPINILIYFNNRNFFILK